MRDRMKKVVNCLLLVVALSLVPAVISCQPATPRQTEDIKPAFELQADMLGALHTLLLDSEGRLVTRAELASDDGAVILSIDKNTRFLDKDRRPLSYISIKKEQEPVSLLGSVKVLTSIYNLGPVGVAFDPALKLTLGYNPQELPEGIGESDVYIASYHEGSGWGQSYYKRMDAENHRVTTLVSGYGSFAVLAPVKPEPEPSSASSAPNLLEVIYFHRPQRCSGCVYAEAGTRYTLETYFAEKLISGKIDFKVINLSDEANAAIVEHYGAYTSALFINSKKDGDENIEEVKEIWFLLGKDSEFIALVKSKIDRYLSGEIP